MAKLYFYYSAMNAGKTTTLLQSAYNYKERGMDALLFAPAFDDRYTIGKITSRIGLEADALLFDESINLWHCINVALKNNPNIQCILVDEAHFLTKKHVLELTQATDVLNIPVLAYGLRTDFRGEPFPGSTYLLSWADELIEIKTICHCGKKATLNMRIDSQGLRVDQGPQIEIGGNDRYLSTCRRHFELHALHHPQFDIVD